MPMSGICRTSLTGRIRQPRAAAGFTLLELTVVLVMVSIVAALALPNLSNLYASINRSTERDYILNQLATLGQTAWTTETNLVVYGSQGSEIITSETEDSSSDSQLGVLDPDPAPEPNSYPGYQEHSLDIPPGWLVRFSEPMLVRASGVCLGAELTLIHESGLSYRASLLPPYCHAPS